MSAYPAHIKRRMPNLAALMNSRKTKPVDLQFRLSRHFSQCQVMWAKGVYPFQLAFECRDSKEAVRMLVLFFWNEEGWTYQPVSRKGAKRVRLEATT